MIYKYLFDNKAFLISLILVVTGAYKFFYYQQKPEAEDYLTYVKSQIEQMPFGQDHVPGVVIVKFKDGTKFSKDSLPEGFHILQKFSKMPGVYILRVPIGEEERIVSDLKQRDDVEFAELDGVYRPADRFYWPDDPEPRDINRKWHIPYLGLPSAWKLVRCNPSIKIALLDTGVNPVEDLEPNLLQGWNFYNQNNDTHDHFGHGTPIASVISAVTDNGQKISGLSFNCKLIPVRISAPEGGAATGVAANAILWAASAGARVVVLEYGMTSSSIVGNAAQVFLQQYSGLTIVPAGNGGTPDPRPNNPYILTVNSIDESLRRTAWSTYGNIIDFCAPGQNISSISRDGNFSVGMGTSYSAPIVGAISALVLSANPSLSGERVIEILKSTAHDLGSPGWDPEFGHGCVNASRAVKTALGAQQPDNLPMIRFVNPQNGSSVIRTIEVDIEAGSCNCLSRVNLFVNDQLLETFLDPFMTNYRFNLNTFTLPRGRNRITVTAMDGGLNTVSESIDIEVANPDDRVPPFLEIVSINNMPPNDGMVIEGPGLVVRVNASDNLGIYRVSLYVNDRFLAGTRTEPWVLRGSITSLASGQHTMRVSAEDLAGNVTDVSLRFLKP